VSSCQTEARRDACLVNGQQQVAVVGWDPLQLRPVDSTAMEVREVMHVTVSMPGAS
jgi:hypothetical protein